VVRTIFTGSIIASFVTSTIRLQMSLISRSLIAQELCTFLSYATLELCAFELLVQCEQELILFTDSFSQLSDLPAI